MKIKFCMFWLVVASSHQIIQFLHPEWDNLIKVSTGYKGAET